MSQGEAIWVVIPFPKTPKVPAVSVPATVYSISAIHIFRPSFDLAAFVGNVDIVDT
jgi:hypothetical protein